ncbi:hypothetical protein [Nonomuraea diastatica]|uniref:hypothetical protein n=1 Tax=Nonomuraea diastatica TaxID=1848329 RepID=UPI00140C0FB6|nr:hypothetical protein [Nonomuraea diastatica]
MLQEKIHQETSTVHFAPRTRLFTTTGAVSVPLAEITEADLLGHTVRAADPGEAANR